MAEKKLTEDQHTQLLQWIAEGLTNREIADLAIQFDPPFKTSPQLCYYYRKHYGTRLQELRAEIDDQALTTGLSIRANRVRALQNLAQLLEDDLRLKHLLWVKQVKGIGSGDSYERIEYNEFNQAEVRELRGVYDDLAKETGGRIQRADITSAGRPIKGYVSVSPDDWDDPPPVEKGRKVSRPRKGS